MLSIPARGDELLEKEGTHFSYGSTPKYNNWAIHIKYTEAYAEEYQKSTKCRYHENIWIYKPLGKILINGNRRTDYADCFADPSWKSTRLKVPFKDIKKTGWTNGKTCMAVILKNNHKVYLLPPGQKPAENAGLLVKEVFVYSVAGGYKKKKRYDQTHYNFEHIEFIEFPQ